MRHLCSWRTMVRTVSVIGLSILTACASPSTHFYTLGAVGGPTIMDSTASPSFRLDMRPVKVPPAVARSQLVVQTNATQVQVLEYERWASSLPDEIRYGLITALSQKAGGLGAKTVNHGGDVPVYRVAVDVQRFESWAGSHALIDLVWEVRTMTDDEALTCHSVVSEPVSDGYEALVGGHRRAISVVAAQVAEAMRAFAARGTESPLRPTGPSGKAGKKLLSCPHATDGVETAADRAVPRLEE